MLFIMATGVAFCTRLTFHSMEQSIPELSRRCRW